MSAPDKLALAVVRWDGGSEDGCSFCGGEWRGGDKQEPEPFILHADGLCPVVAHRLELIDRLITGDPAPDSDDGKLLVELVAEQARWEKARYETL